MSQSIFISYARGDDEPFTKRLYENLTNAGFMVWWDRVSMPSRRLTFHQEIADAIRSHDRLILIVGPMAAISDSVRQEWRWALELDKPVIPILRKGDYTHVPGELSLLHCDDFRDPTEYAAQFAKLIENLRRPEPPLGALFGVPSLPPHFLARSDLLRQVKADLLADLKKPVIITASDARVGVHGMGGIGKSVLAAAIARDQEVRRSYPDGVIWLTFGQQPNLVTLQHDVARHLGSKEHFDTRPQGQGVLQQLLAQKAVLLVLDDVWQARDAQAFDVLGPRCRALVTTRDAGVLHTLGGPSVPVSFLTEEQALQLLANTFGVTPPDLPPEAREVVNECGCLPLAVALCGGMVKKRAGDWTAILERLRNADIEKIADPHAIDERHRSIWRTMQVSVDVLPTDEQGRFAELAVFATDHPVPEAAVATLWSHTSNLSDLDTTDLLINLAERSLICLHQTRAEPGEPIERLISLHDLLYDFVTRLAGPAKPLHRTLLDAYREKCANGWPTGPNDGYFYLHLAYHLHAAGKQQELRKLLFGYCWMQKKLEVADPNDLIADYEFLPGDSELRLIQDAIRLSRQALTEDRSCLLSQLFGRLPSHTNNWVESLLGQAEEHQVQPWLKPMLASLATPRGELLWRLRAHKGKVLALAATSDGKYAVSGASDQTLKVWDLQRGSVVHVLMGHDAEVNAVAVATNGRYVVSGSDDHTVKVWDSSTSALLWNLEGHAGPVHSVALTPDGRSAVTASCDEVIVWALKTGRCLRRIVVREAEPKPTVNTTLDGELFLAVADDATIVLWDPRNRRVVRKLGSHLLKVSLVRVTADSRYAVSYGILESVVKVWDLKAGRLAHEFGCHEELVSALALAPVGHYAASVSKRKIIVWNVGTGRVAWSLEQYNPEVISAAVTTDGHYVICGSEWGMLWVWDTSVGKARRGVLRHTDFVRTVAITPSARCAVSGSGDMTLKVWDPASGKAVQTLRGHEGAVTAVAVTPDGRYVLSSSLDGIMKLWDAISLALTGPDFARSCCRRCREDRSCWERTSHCCQLQA